jgi:hypothetical protein
MTFHELAVTFQADVEDVRTRLQSSGVLAHEADSVRSLLSRLLDGRESVGGILGLSFALYRATRREPFEPDGGPGEVALRDLADSAENIKRVLDCAQAISYSLPRTLTPDTAESARAVHGYIAQLVGVVASMADDLVTETVHAESALAEHPPPVRLADVQERMSGSLAYINRDLLPGISEAVRTLADVGADAGMIAAFLEGCHYEPLIGAPPIRDDLAQSIVRFTDSETGETLTGTQVNLSEIDELTGTYGAATHGEPGDGRLAVHVIHKRRSVPASTLTPGAKAPVDGRLRPLANVDISGDVVRVDTTDGRSAEFAADEMVQARRRELVVWVAPERLERGRRRYRLAEDGRLDDLLAAARDLAQQLSA